MSLTNDLELNISTYKYKIEMLYLNNETGESQPIDPLNIKSVCIDNNYSNTNMPQIFVTASLNVKLIKDMYDNSTTNLINLTIYKFNDSSDIELDELYLRQQYAYFINDRSGIIDMDVEYEEKVKDRDDLFRDVQIGLLQLNLINNNKKTTSTIMNSTTMTNAVYTVTSHMNVLLEPLLYDTMIDQLIIPPMDSVSKIIQYLNSNRVFYNTNYRYFMDADTTYILSSSGVSTQKIGDTHNKVIIEISKSGIDIIEDIVGIGERNNAYYLYINWTNMKMKKNKITEKRFNQIDAIATDGEIINTELDRINNSSYINNKVSSVRVRQSNPNMYKTLKSGTESDMITLAINKNDIDTSVITPNKQFIVYNEGDMDSNGVYIMNRKRELFIREGKEIFMVNVMLDLNRVDPEKLIESSGPEAEKNSRIIGNLFGNPNISFDDLT